MICDDCSIWDDSERYLVSWEDEVNIRETVRKALERHNEKLNEVWNRCFSYVKRNSKIRYLEENNLWEISYYENEKDIIRELIGSSELSFEKIKKAWNV